MYYRISANTDTSEDGTCETYEYLEVETKEQAERALQEMIRDIKDDMFLNDKDIRSSVKEVSIEECISEEERINMGYAENLYERLHYNLDTITVKEYISLKEARRKDPRRKWLMLKDVNTLTRQFDFLRRTCDLQKMPTAVFEESAKRLFCSVGTPQFEKIVMEICQIYGKEQFRLSANEK